MFPIAHYRDMPERFSGLAVNRRTGALVMSGEDGDAGGRNEIGIAVKSKPKTKRPNMYRVLLLNDDYTPMEFVVHILQEVFNRSAEDAWQIMMHVHKQGVGECGIYPYEVAETKVTRVMDAARKNQHPLQCIMEKK